jgi:recombinational DNA repair ATPase RecF
MLKLSRLRIEGCRGIKDGPDLVFEIGGLILQGDNGVGKSSYIDGLEKVLTGSCTTVESGDQGISWARFGQNLASTNTFVDLTAVDGSTEVHFSFDGRKVKLPPLAEFNEAVQQQSFILRRRTLLSFIDCKPAERYKALEGFLNLCDFDSFEKGIKQAKVAEEAERTLAESKVVNAENIFRLKLTMPPTDVITEPNCLRAANASLSKVNLPEITRLGQATDRLIEVKARLDSFSNMDELMILTSLKAILETPISLDELAAAVATIKSLKAQLRVEELRTTGSFFEEVLQKGLQWIEADGLTNCPLCEASLNREALRTSVEKRLEDNQQIISLKGFITAGRLARTNAFQSLLSKLERINDSIKAPVSIEDFQSIRDAQATLSTLGADVSDEVIGEALDRLLSGSVLADLSRLKSVTNDLLEARPEDRDAFDALNDAAEILQAISMDLASVMAQRRLLRDARIRVGLMEKLCAHAEAARKNAVTEVISQVAEIANGYFQAIHPGEKIGQPALQVAKTGTASLNLSSTFYEKKGDPRGLFSEGHVDSLGLCLFLAIRRLHHTQNPALSILVLDDVLHSVDGEHRKRTAKLIFNEFADHQIIITTHDPIWFEYLKSFAQTSGRKFAMRRIASWTLENGPQLGDHLSDYEWLRAPVGALARPQDRAAKAGRLLEQLLQGCCDGISAPVPFSIRGDYTIGPLWDSFFSRAKKFPGFETKAVGTLLEIHETKEVRNFGAHWNDWSQQLTDAEATRFATAIVDFRHLVFCDQCVEFIKSIKGLDSVWSCRKQHLFYEKIPSPQQPIPNAEN